MRHRLKFIIPAGLITFLLAFFLWRFVFSSPLVLSGINPSPPRHDAEGWTHILFLALDRRENVDPRCEGGVSGNLTDTLGVASFNPEERKAVVFSLPRDLWVNGARINSFYQTGGIPAVKEAVSKVLGLSPHYFVVVDMAGFKEAVDALGGIEVEVERGFDDYKYPREGFECDPNLYLRYEHIHFDAGKQKMDGETALNFARSRNALGPEGSDFARMARQQKVMLALFDKARSLSLWDMGKIKSLYQTFLSDVETDISLSEAISLARKAKGIKEEDIQTLVLSDRFFYHPKTADSYGGAWVLRPKEGDFSVLRRFVEETLKK